MAGNAENVSIWWRHYVHNACKVTVNNMGKYDFWIHGGGGGGGGGGVKKTCELLNPRALKI